MGTLTTPAVPATAPRTIVADPNETPKDFGVEPGGILVWSNRSHKFKMFEIEFLDGVSPASPGDLLAGTSSVVVHVPATTIGTFRYQINYFPATGTPETVGTFSVRSCHGC
jgi:hypothetical protein